MDLKTTKVDLTIMLNNDNDQLTIQPNQLTQLTASEISQMVRERKISCETLVHLYFQNIEKQQSLNAFISIDKDSALAQAQFWDLQLQSDAESPALIGVLIAVKDNIHVAGFTNSAGTPALAHFQPQSSAPIIQKLVDHGAIIVGKTTLHELAFGVTGYNTSTQFQGVIGARNARNQQHIAGGSSSGSAVTVAAGMVPIAIGTDTGGSIRIPAALNGCAGFRPSTGRYSQAGITPISHTRDTAGPMAHCVSDIALIDHLITDQTIQAPKPAEQIRLGISSYFWNNLEHDVKHQTEHALEHLLAAGVQLIPVELPELEHINQSISFPLVIHEGKHDLVQYLKDYKTNISIESIVEQISSPDVRAIFEQNILPEQISDHTGELHPVCVAYEQAMKVSRPQLLALYQKTYAEHNLNALIFPTTTVVAPLANEHVSSMENFQTLIRNTDPGSNIGLPGLSLPIGIAKTSKLPIALEIDGLPHSDHELLAIGATLEQLFKPLNQI